MDQQPEDYRFELERALAAGRKIEAIKIYRDATGVGLKEAKEFVDALVVELREKDPEKYAKLSQGAGCASMILFLLVLPVVSVLLITRFFAT